jgi:hypothetical protein
VIGCALLGAGLPLTAAMALDPRPEEYWQLPIPSQGAPPTAAVALTKPLDAAACGLCHRRQYAEWQGSLHARAVGPGLLGQLPAMDRAEATQCLTCHAPRREQQDRILADPLAGGLLRSPPAVPRVPSAAPAVGGIDCAGCHVRAHRRFGPTDTPITPHGGVVGLPLFRDSDFCAPCHQFPEGVGEIAGKPLEDTLEEWSASRYAATGTSCQACHMPDGSHAFRGIHDPATTRRALTLRVRREAEGVLLTLCNSGAGHALPTYATPRIRLLLRAGDGTAEVAHELQRRLVWDPDEGLVEIADTRLMPDAQVRLRLPLGTEQRAEAEVRVAPDAFYHEVVYPTLLAGEGAGDATAGPPAAGRLLARARAASGADFVLYRADCGPWQGRPMDCRLRPPPASSRTAAAGAAAHPCPPGAAAAGAGPAIPTKGTSPGY